MPRLVADHGSAREADIGGVELFVRSDLTVGNLDFDCIGRQEWCLHDGDFGFGTIGEDSAEVRGLIAFEVRCLRGLSPAQCNIAKSVPYVSASALVSSKPKIRTR